MNQEEIIKLAREAGGFDITSHGWTSWVGTQSTEFLERFAALAVAAEREKVAAWMTRQGCATGHGDSIEDLLKELEWQIRESERNACAKVCDVLAVHPEYASDITKLAAQAIRARGKQ